MTPDRLCTDAWKRATQEADWWVSYSKRLKKALGQAMTAYKYINDYAGNPDSPVYEVNMDWVDREFIGACACHVEYKAEALEAFVARWAKRTKVRE